MGGHVPLMHTVIFDQNYFHSYGPGGGWEWVKVSKSRKQFMVSSIVPKNERWDNFMYWKLSQRSFFGRIEDTIICFRDCLTFKTRSFQRQASLTGKIWGCSCTLCNRSSAIPEWSINHILVPEGFHEMRGPWIGQWSSSQLFNWRSWTRDKLHWSIPETICGVKSKYGFAYFQKFPF